MAGPDDRSSHDPDALTKVLEMELQLKRAFWQQARSRRGTWRTLSFIFLALVILGALFSFFYLLPQLQRESGEKPAIKSDR